MAIFRLSGERIRRRYINKAENRAGEGTITSALALF